MRQHNGQLLGPVVTEIEEDHHISRLYRSHGLSGLVHANNRFDKLIGHTRVIRSLHSRLGVRYRSPHAIHQQVISLLDTLPAGITIHGIIASDHGSDLTRGLFHVILQLTDKTLSTLRIRVPAVHKTMNKGFLDPELLRQITQGKHVIERTMYPTVRNQSHEMHLFPVLLGIVKRLHDFRILCNGMISTRPVYLHQILVNYPSGPNIQVSDFGIPHLTVRQPHILPARVQQSTRIITCQFRDVRSRRTPYRIRMIVFSNTPTIQYHQQNSLHIYFIFCYLLF